MQIKIPKLSLVVLVGPSVPILNLPFDSSKLSLPLPQIKNRIEIKH